MFSLWHTSAVPGSYFTAMGYCGLVLSPLLVYVGGGLGFWLLLWSVVLCVPTSMLLSVVFRLVLPPRLERVD